MTASLSKLIVFPVEGEETTEVLLDNLTPKTQYNIKVYAVNNVGQGQVKNFMETTSDISECFSVNHSFHPPSTQSHLPFCEKYTVIIRCN